MELAARLPALGTGLSIASDVLQRLMADMRGRQTVFEATGPVLFFCWSLGYPQVQPQPSSGAGSLSCRMAPG